MSVRSTINGSTVLERDGQVFDAFAVTVHDDEEFGGVYTFDQSWGELDALDAIFTSEVLPDSEGV
jgi:hypothetical protein